MDQPDPLTGSEVLLLCVWLESRTSIRPLHQSMLIAVMVNVCELRHAQPSKAALWEWRCPRRHVLRVVRGEEESTPWDLLSEVSAPHPRASLPFRHVLRCFGRIPERVTCQKITPFQGSLGEFPCDSRDLSRQ